MKFNVTIRGIAPLLMHRFDPSALTKVKKPSADKQLTDKEKVAMAEPYLYVEKGKLVQPSSHVEGAMIKAATEIRLAGAGKKTYKDHVKSSCFVYPERIDHKQQKWTVDERSIVNQTTRGRSMCYRPRLDDWELSFELEVLDSRADAAAIREVLTIAGLRQGLGAYRPRFGRFEVVSFEEITKESKKKK